MKEKKGNVKITYDILRAIHECLDIPERRTFERAMGWGLTGIKKLTPEQKCQTEDLLLLRERFRVPRSPRNFSQEARIPIGDTGKSYFLSTFNPFTPSIHSCVKYCEDTCRELNR